jgi:transcriptional regulator with XRE-family HTH domain
MLIRPKKKRTKLPEYSIVLRGLRLCEGLSQEQLSKLTGIPREKISWFENGKARISQKYQEILADVLHTNICMFE